MMFARDFAGAILDEVAAREAAENHERAVRFFKRQH